MEMKEKICVYTCMTGNYDNVKEIINKEEGVDYFFFTNNKSIKSDTWKVIYIEDKELNDFYLSRKIKMLGTDLTNKYDIAIWQDASVQFKKSIKEFVNKYKNKEDNFVAFKHGERSSVKDEANACYRFFKDSRENLHKLLNFYEKENYPDNNGLMEATVFIKNPKDQIVQETMNMWFDMLLKFGKRDQLLFPYCAYKTNLKIKWIEEKVFDNEWFTWSNHIQKKYPEEYSIYYGNVYEYDMENDFHYKYKMKDDTFHINVTCRKDSDITYINLNCNPCTEIKDLKVSNIRKYELKNHTIYKDKIVFLNTFPFIIINKKLKKGDKINISFELEELSEQEKMELVNQLGDQTISLNYKIDHLNAVIKNYEEISEQKLYRKVGARIIKIFSNKDN